MSQLTRFIMGLSLPLSLLSPSPLASSYALRPGRQTTSPRPPPLLPRFASLPSFHSLHHAATPSRSLRPSALGSGSATGALLQDAGATAAVLAGAYSLVLTFDTLTENNFIQQVSPSTDLLSVPSQGN